ncbi:MAG: tRNA preQ1(34) S-adenosylmethionine ribosyltransferase-isomerase QueA, partial [Woeseiaceae bacterium]
VERITGTHTALAHLRSSKPAKPGSVMEFPGGASAEVAAREAALFELRFTVPVKEYLEEHGETPLPPYLGREAQPADDARYQTVYAKHHGAVAAPTAGLHFDKELLDESLQMGARHAFVTLHVGAGTFQSLREESVAQNRLHAERVTVSQETCEAVRETRANGGRVVAVGTTSVRALEAASVEGAIRPLHGETTLFIVPGYRFHSVDLLLTNFHLPRSSLLMLVAAFAGRDFVLEAYRHAVDQRYRFFSYGDAMFVIPQANSFNET